MLTNNFNAYPFKKYFIWMEHDVTYEHAIYICIFVIDQFLFRNVYLDMLISITIWNPLDLTYYVASSFKIIICSIQRPYRYTVIFCFIYLKRFNISVDKNTNLFSHVGTDSDFKPDFESIHNFLFVSFSIIYSYKNSNRFISWNGNFIMETPRTKDLSPSST